MQLVIGNKNYSSWSMRPWVLMRQLDLHFEEVKLRFDFTPGSAFRRAVAHHSPAGQVPILIDDSFSVWDSLAIIEYLNEKFPGRGIWPEDIQARARARCNVAEMHAGFGALRNACPMNIEADLSAVGAKIWAEQPAVRANVERIEVMWLEALTNSGGPFLFGAFGAVDAMFAPVCMRFLSYGLPLQPHVKSYVDRVAAAPGVAAWIKDALAEHDYILEDEPYRNADRSLKA
jgi:glutathione S-transferase